MNLLRVHYVLDQTTSLGPGKRYALWLQGCHKRCPNCMTPASRDLDGGQMLDVSVIATKILLQKEIEGITISGGEPFLQPEGLCELLQLIRSQSDLSIIIYTGYYISELREWKNHFVDEILDHHTDILIDGPYIQELNDGGSLRGSKNQTVYALSPRYRDIVTGLYGQPERHCEIHLNQNEALLVGIPDENGYKMWRLVFRAD